jgi:hypothetical protein
LFFCKTGLVDGQIGVYVFGIERRKSMLRFYPEREKVWRLALVGAVCADYEFTNLEEQLRRLPDVEMTVIVDITKLSELSDSGREFLPHLFGTMRNHGFHRGNLIARKRQAQQAEVFEFILDRTFGPGGSKTFQ